MDSAKELKSLRLGTEPVGKLIFKMSTPTMISMLVQGLYNIVDSIFVSNYSQAGLTALSYAYPMQMLVLAVALGVGVGVNSLISRRLGEKNYDQATLAAQTGVFIALCSGVLFAVCGYFISQCFISLYATGEVYEMGVDYLSICICCSMFPCVEISMNRAIQATGNTIVPMISQLLGAATNIIFDPLLIFGIGFPRMGVTGAALGTALAELVVAGLMLWYLVTRSGELRIAGERGSFRPTWDIARKALHISLPMGVEHIVICGAQIMTTVIVAPLGVFAIAANSFGITAESLCYMPGYGIADAATTLVGQSLGAGRKDLTRRFARITVGMGMAVMGVMGVILYVGAPLIMGSMTPDAEVQRLGVEALRIEAFAEPMFAAAIVAYGVFVGAGNTLVPCLMNFFSIWAVRLTLAAALAPSMGLNGVWLAMCIELCFRGLIFLLRLEKGNWMKIK